MPAAYTRTPAEVEPREPGHWEPGHGDPGHGDPGHGDPGHREPGRGETGIGGKPPFDLRPTGGGGSGDDEWNPAGRGPRELLNRFRFFVFFALAGDMMFFAALAMMFFARQAGSALNPRTHEFIGDWHPVLLPPILYLNTAVLLISSLTVEIARRNIFRELDVVEEWLGLGRPALKRALPWLGATLALGLLFLVGQTMAWSQLTQQGFAFDRWSTPASYFFYVITGFHALHLLLGLAALAGGLAGIRFLGKIEYRQIAVDCTAWYWHTMGLAWGLLFFLLATGQ